MFLLWKKSTQKLNLCSFCFQKLLLRLFLLLHYFSQGGSRGWGRGAQAPPIFLKYRGNNDVIAVYDVIVTKGRPHQYFFLCYLPALHHGNLCDSKINKRGSDISLLSRWNLISSTRAKIIMFPAGFEPATLCV